MFVKDALSVEKSGKVGSLYCTQLHEKVSSGRSCFLIAGLTWYGLNTSYTYVL